MLTSADLAESHTLNAASWRKLKAARSPTVATLAGSGRRQGSLRLAGTVTGGGGLIVAQPVKPSPQDRLRDRAISARRGLNDLDGGIGTFPDNDCALRVFVQRPRGDFGLPLGLLGGCYSGLCLLGGIVSAM